MESNISAPRASKREQPRLGRPRKLSHDAVLDAALALLAEIQPEEFTLAKLAQRLGASTMSLYTYYPSRELLLEAVAGRAFDRFEFSPPQDSWQKTVLAWLWALQRHVDIHPVAIKVMAWNGRVPVAWLRIWTPILHMLNAQGLEGMELANTFDWFINAAIGLIVTQHHAIEASKSLSIGDVGSLPPQDGLLLLRMLYDLQNIPRESRYELGFRRLVDGLEQCIAESKARPPGKGLADAPA